MKGRLYVYNLKEIFLIFVYSVLGKRVLNTLDYSRSLQNQSIPRSINPHLSIRSLIDVLSLMCLVLLGSVVCPPLPRLTLLLLP